ncbi:nucleolar protein 58-like [Notolabrus celidotus]|uniref:nucleolar protein 58-like n=1 Tax=Notolabrus celidotus TaxID=1203425 RepID=UPI0014903B3D|nr:nucleolar protein 58-like [Notolabrus celidotus]
MACLFHGSAPVRAPALKYNPVHGWEESCDAAVSHLLRTCLSRSPKDQATSLAQTGSPMLGLPQDTARLKRHITVLCERIGKGGRLTLASESNTPVPVQVQSLAAPGGVEPISELAGDQDELGQEATKFIKKKQASKKVKKDKEKKEVSPEASLKEEAGAEESGKEAKKEKKESSKEKKESKKELSKEPKEEGKKESKKESSSSSSKEKKESSKEKKERDKDKEGKETSKESGEKKVSRKSSVKVKEKKKEPEAGDA